MLTAFWYLIQLNPKLTETLISRGSFNRREGFSKFNKIYEFKAAYDGAQADFVMTSASGHIQSYEFPIQYKKWDNISPGALFNAQE